MTSSSQRGMDLIERVVRWKAERVMKLLNATVGHTMAYTCPFIDRVFSAGHVSDVKMMCSSLSGSGRYGAGDSFSTPGTVTGEDTARIA